MKWLPKPVAIRSGTTTQIDTDVRALADTYSMSDIKSARAGESVIPRPVAPPPSQQGPATTIEPVPGMRANVNWGSISCNAVTPQIPNEAPQFSGPRRKPPKLSDYTGRRYE